MSWHRGMPNAIDARRARYADWVAGAGDRATRRERLHDLPIHDREPVRRLVEQRWADRHRDRRQGAA
ncbi:hypothetical protein P8631_00835 [Guyparkeria sp. 1SP6A2]|nr:hypothetical protein [Guyparkeria sp. 1SP6A2]